jgi:hypothetical protein
MSLSDKPFSRREFAQKAALGAASAAVLPLGEFVAPATVAEGQAPPVQEQTAGGGKLSPQSQAEADARYQSILRQYGERLTEAQKIDLKRLSDFAQEPLDRIRAYAVSNGDLPALYLKPLVDRDKKATEPAGSKKSSAVSPTGKRS